MRDSNAGLLHTQGIYSGSFSARFAQRAHGRASTAGCDRRTTPARVATKAARAALSEPHVRPQTMPLVDCARTCTDLWLSRNLEGVIRAKQAQATALLDELLRELQIP